MAERSSRPRTAIIAVLAVAVLVLACGLGWFLGRDGGDEPPAPTATSGASAGTADEPGGETDGECGLPVGSQEVPTEGPEATWEVRRSLTVPSSEEFGPGEVTEDGDRRCFAHNPTGALFFVLNFQGLATEQQDDHVVGGMPDTAGSSASTPSGVVLSVRGFQLEATGPDQVDVTVVYQLDEDQFALRIGATWEDDRWMVTEEGLRADRIEVSEVGDYVSWGPQ